MQHQGAVGDAREFLRSTGVGCDRHHLAQRAHRVKAALYPRQNTLAHAGFVNREGGAANRFEQVNVMTQHCLRVFACGAGQHGPHHLAFGLRQAARATGTHDAGEAQHPLWRGNGNALRNHAAHAHAHHVRLAHGQRVQHPQRILGHVLQRVGRAHFHAHLELEHFPHQVGFAQLVKVLRQANVAVVKPYHPVARIHQRLHQLRWPSHQLHAQTHDEQNHRARRLRRLGSARVFHFNVDTVCSYFHSCMPRFYNGFRPIDH